jgi:FAD/FMN-containing dehydrogenase
VDLTAFADEVGPTGPVTITGLGTRGGPVPGVRMVRPPTGIEWIQADEMTMRCGAGTAVADVDAALAEVGQRVAFPPDGTVGGALSVGHSGIRRLGDGPVREVLLQACYVSDGGQVVQAGGPTVKNVSGFDLCRLLVGAQGTLGFLGDVILRTRPRPSRCPTRSRSLRCSIAQHRCCGTGPGSGRCWRVIPRMWPPRQPVAR